MMTCPYSGVSVSRAEDCPEFGGGGGGGGGGCANSYSNDCGEDDPGEPEITGMDSDTRKIKNCMANRSHGEKFLDGIKNAHITFEYRALEATEGHTSGLRLGKTSGSNGNYTITIDTAAIERNARSANWSYRQLLAEVLVHELMHVSYDMDPDRNLSAPHTLGDALYRDAWDLYKKIFGVKAPQNDYSPAFDGALPRCLED